jgi:hypothetical protein
LTSILEDAGRWLIQSGIQEPSGGVARYYRSDSRQNAPVSAEITGYAVSALVYLHRAIPSAETKAACLDAAMRAARYLTREAWDEASATFPFEPGSPRAYFFDTGIIVRGLLAAWKVTGENEFYSRARDAALSMAFDFLGDGVIHPIISLPDKKPLDREASWSKNPGCYQLKSALAWLGLEDQHARRMFETVLEQALATHDSFLPGAGDQEKVMDRLHAYCYFLEALLAVADRKECRVALAGGIDRVGTLLREIAPSFERSDVGAQLLRIRLIAGHLGAVALNERAACEEADRAASFEVRPDDAPGDPRTRGGFWFGKRQSQTLPFVNPVSTVFCAQALHLWEQHRAGKWEFELWELI